jgi:hypothetical protein
MFSVQIVADSVNPNGKRITTMLLTYQRYIHSELMTHRVFSRNAASSRAIPIEKMIAAVESDPAMPIRWGKNGKGMQDHGVFPPSEARVCRQIWLEAAKSAIYHANRMKEFGVHKQITNRLLEPFQWMTTLVTATEWENFFALRVHKDAHPDFQYLAYNMLKAYVGNKPELRAWGEWHIPFGDRMPTMIKESDGMPVRDHEYQRPATVEDWLKIATSRAARISYNTIEGDNDVHKEFGRHDMLFANGHYSPPEHCAKAENPEHSLFDATLQGNFRGGWLQYRHIMGAQSNTGGERQCDPAKLLTDYEATIK